MRRLLLPLVALALAAALLPAAASARSSYCSQTGDLCYGKVRGSSPVRLGITLAGDYFSRYRLCVTNPHGARECHRFRIRARDNGTFGSVVSWPKHFEYGGKGTYRARWFALGGPLGPAVTF
jgi:hypothetical protein